MNQAVLKNQVTELELENGLQADERKAVADAISSTVADTYRIFIMTQALHWNVQGPLFYSIHKLTEEQYNEMFAAIDELAERVRAVGFPAPQTVAELTQNSEIAEAPRDSDLETQIKALVEANEQLAKSLREAVAKAERKGDVKTADLLTHRIGVHEDNAWMLRATIAS